MIRKCTDSDFEAMYEIINDAATAYKGVIPADRWKEPYMLEDELSHEISQDVLFWGYEEAGRLVGVMGIQDVKDVMLIRHAYVRTTMRSRGIGSKLLTFLLSQSTRPVLIGTWKAATWAISFYQKHGFTCVSEEEKNMLLKKYWIIPPRQVETSTVLADQKWIELQKRRDAD
jgi:N-acetylglutamate synthase-like GNAT family acetyltransferase